LIFNRAASVIGGALRALLRRAWIVRNGCPFAQASGCARMWVGVALLSDWRAAVVVAVAGTAAAAAVETACALTATAGAAVVVLLWLAVAWVAAAVAAAGAAAGAAAAAAGAAASAEVMDVTAAGAAAAAAAVAAVGVAVEAGRAARFLAFAAAEAGMREASPIVVGFSASATSGSVCHLNSGIARRRNFVFVRGCSPRQSLVQTVVVPALRGWQGRVKPTADSVV
jgi:hypothetical protein